MIMHWMWQSPTVFLLLRALWQTLRGAGLVDYFDVAAVTFLIYLALLWIRRARAVRVLQGILLIGVLYAVALQAGLTLTTSLFRGLLTVVMLSMVSLFQEDMRRFFERLTVYERHPMHRHMFQSLLRSIRHFSKHHIGALIVLKGRDPLERHLEGGQPLDGRMSSALLESLFDPHSDGHDGAAIIDGDHLKRFAVHLPLSKHLDPDMALGTRHAAALGLAELTDAFCLVVSETRGSVMVARDGELINMGGGQRLEKRLADFLRERFQVPASTRSWRMVWRHPFEKSLALFFGLALWLVFVKGIRPSEQVLTLPVQVMQVPAGVMVETLVPAKVSVTLHGLEKDLRVLPADLTVMVDVPRVYGSSQRLMLVSQNVHVPAAITVTAISPASVTARLKGIRSSSHHNPAKQSASHHAWFKF